MRAGEDPARPLALATICGSRPSVLRAPSLRRLPGGGRGTWARPDHGVSL